MKKELIRFNKLDLVTKSTVEDTVYLIVPDIKQTGQKSLLVNMVRENIRCRIICGYKVGQENTVDLATTVIHKAPNTSCETVVRGVLYDGGISKYVGSIVIEAKAQGSYSQLDDKILVVGNGIRNHSEPTLNIEANDVTASHASSMGRVDENQIYYLRSRGLSREESQNLLIESFLSITKV